MLHVNHRVYDAIEAPRGLLQRLLLLTNASTRGDLRDNGEYAGSSFYERLLEQINGLGRFPVMSWIIVALNGGEIVGWCLVESSFMNKNAAMVGFYVDPTFRRTGVGGGLVDAAEVQAFRKGFKKLCASPWNRGSSDFFASRGFVTMTSYVSGVHSGRSEKLLAP